MAIKLTFPLALFLFSLCALYLLCFLYCLLFSPCFTLRPVTLKLSYFLSNQKSDSFIPIVFILLSVKLATLLWLRLLLLHQLIVKLDLSWHFAEEVFLLYTKLFSLVLYPVNRKTGHLSKWVSLEDICSNSYRIFSTGDFSLFQYNASCEGNL